MTNAKQIITYWRDSLRDAELASLELTKDNHIRLSSDLLEDGQLDERQTAVLFSNHNKKDVDTMPVIVAPIVASRGSRGYRQRNKALCPLLIPAELSKDGNLCSDGNMWIPRPLLEPTSSDFILGSVDALDNFWENNENSSNSWSETLHLGWRMLRHVTNGEGQSILKNAGYIESDSAAVIDASNLRGMSTNIIAVYDDLLTEKQLPPLFRKITNLQSPSPRHPLPMSSWLEPAKLHLGSFNNQHSLSPSQREALYHLFTLSENDILAVSGPPGTGKTTLLHSVIASLWVKSALQGESPPVIVAASTNNQAVMNVIDSLSGIDGISRWLPVSSFGLYLVNSPDKQAEAVQRGILSVNKYDEGFPKQVETIDFVNQATEQYLSSCSRYFERKIETVDEAVTALHVMLVRKHDVYSRSLDTMFQKADVASLLDDIRLQYGSLQTYQSELIQKIVASQSQTAFLRSYKIELARQLNVIEKKHNSLQVHESELIMKLDAIQAQYSSLQLHEAIYQKQHIEAVKELESCYELHAVWLQYIQDEPISYRLFGFMPGVRAKRKTGYQIFLEKHMSDVSVMPDQTVITQSLERQIQTAKMVVGSAEQLLQDMMDKRIQITENAVIEVKESLQNTIDKRVRGIKTAVIQVEQQLQDGISRRIQSIESDIFDVKRQLRNVSELLELDEKLEVEWDKWKFQLGADIEWDQLYFLETEDNASNNANFLNWLDTHLRYDLLLLAVHYWEGCWLQEIEKKGIVKPDFTKESRNQRTQKEKWQRYAMLTPCFVTTMHTGPSFFNYYDGESNPLLDYIDLLIVDEAGQVAPEVSGAMFALAKQAFVVGDVKQIEPVWSIIEQVDYGNLERYNLIQNDADFSRMAARGITSSSGSVMQMAQAVSPYQIPPRDGIMYDRGMFLAEHRRCVPEIIAYCNELAYNGRLRPMRPSLEGNCENYPWPYMGYVHIKGRSITVRGSRKNDREAQTIVDWIADNKDKLEKYYQEELEDIIGIITPFSAQKQALFRELKKRGIKLSKVGTVHALQGGERPIVLFSSVYTTRDGTRYFFDRGPNMLNVAVSRAKDSFIVFGDMGIFDPKLDTPSGLLARYLFADESNEMVGVPVHSRVEVKDAISHIRSLDKHVRTLARAFERAEKRVVIVSPYLRWRAVEADGICEQVKTAVNRGVNVDIYVDEGFNENLKLPAAAQAASALRVNGAKVHVCHNIHSKIICKDDDVFIEGSFNWLSAERNIPNYTRYETSMIHSGAMASGFIEEVLSDIQQRVIT